MLILTLAACSKPASKAVATPKEAAAQIDHAFKEAPREIKKSAETAAEALRSGDYEGAVVSIYNIQNQKDITPEQFRTAHESMVVLQAKLISGLQAGDERAKKASELLKQMRGD